MTQPFNKVTLGICSSGGEAFDFVCLRKLCALEFRHNSAKSFDEFLLLTSRDIGRHQRTEHSVEGKVGPYLLGGKHPLRHVQVYKMRWRKLVTCLAKEAASLLAVMFRHDGQLGSYICTCYYEMSREKKRSVQDFLSHYF